MVCKKCGNELIEGIDICPFCGETSSIEEEKDVKEIVNGLDDLKIDLDEEEKQEDVYEEALALTQDLENLKMEIESLDAKEDSIEAQDIDIEEEKVETEEIPSINDIVSNIKELDNEISIPSTDLGFAKIDMSNYIDDAKSEEVTESEDSEEPLEIKVSDNEVEVPTTEEENAEVTTDNNEENIDDETVTEIKEETNELPDIKDLIEDIKEIPVEETNEDETPIIEDIKPIENNDITYDLLNDLRSVKVEGIKPIINDIDIKEEVSSEENNAPIKNDYLITNFELKDENSIEEENEDVEEQLEVDESNKVDMSQIDEDNLRLKSDKLNVEDKEEKVYINEALTDNVEKSAETQELQPTNNELMKQHSEQKVEETTPSIEKQPKKSNTNYMVAILFVLMIILGIAAALVFSHIFNL